MSTFFQANQQLPITTVYSSNCVTIGVNRSGIFTSTFYGIVIPADGHFNGFIFLFCTVFEGTCCHSNRLTYSPLFYMCIFSDISAVTDEDI